MYLRCDSRECIRGSLDRKQVLVPTSVIADFDNDNLGDRIATADFHLILVAQDVFGSVVGEVVETTEGTASTWAAENEDVEEVSVEGIDQLLGDGWVLCRQNFKHAPSYVPPAPPPVDIDDLKAKRFGAVDQKTRHLIEEGFSYGDETFSLSERAQLTWLGMLSARSSLAYPIEVSSKDDTAVVQLADQEAVETFYAACVMAVREALDSGTTLKQQIAAAQTVEDVQAVVDNR